MDFVADLSGQVIQWSITPEMVNSLSNGLRPVLGAVLGGFFMVYMIVMVVVIVFSIICKWRVLEKGNLPGWGILIPIYNIYLMFKLAGRPGGWTRWLLFPPVLAILMLITLFDTAKRFNKHWTFGLGLLFLPIIFRAILAFDKSKYSPRK